MENNHIVQNETNLVRRVASLYTYRSLQHLISGRQLILTCFCIYSVYHHTHVYTLLLGDLQGFLHYTLRTVGAEDKQLLSIILCMCVFILNYILQIEKLRHFAKLTVECSAFTSKECLLIPVDTFPRSLWSFFSHVEYLVFSKV